MPKQHVLHVIHGSHPCVAVERALALKGQTWKVREIIAGSQAIVMRLRFGGSTVPAIRFSNGEKVQGSMAIMRRLDELFRFGTRPAALLAHRLVPQFDGNQPAGTLALT